MTHSLRVLITNDQEWTLRSLESVLAPLDLEVSRAFNCAQAIAALERQAHDLVFLDTHLPDGDGLSLTRQIRERGLVEVDVPIIMTTSGHVGRRERVQAHEAGAWEYLAEPFDGAVLTARMRVYIAARLGARARMTSGVMPVGWMTPLPFPT